MKNINKWLFAACGVLMLSSCADYFDTNNYVVQRPGNSEQYEYLKDYQPLKEYLDRASYPNFKVSAALTASEFNKKDMLYALASSNFDEVVAGNAMKMSSCVTDKGEMDFGSVTTFVETAEQAGLTVYGHTLAWHSQQPNKWLRSLIADKPKPVDPNDQGGEREVVDGYVDFTTMTKFPYYVMGYEPTFDTGMLHSEYPGSWYQYFIADGISIPAEGDYSAIVRIRSDREGTLALNMGWGWGDGEQAQGSISVKEGWTEAVAKFSNIPQKSVNLVLQPGVFEGPIDIEWVKVVHYEATGNSNVEYKEVWTNQITNSDMVAGQSMSCFVVRDATSGDDHPGEAIAGGPNGMNCLKVTGKTQTTYPWDTQFFIYTPNKQWEAGEKYRLHMWYKATQNIGTDSQCHGAPGSYMHWQMLNPNPSFTTEWIEKTWEGTIPSEGNGMQSIAFNLNKNRTASDGDAETVGEIDYYFAGIEWSTCELIEVPKVEIVTTDYVNNSDMEGNDASNFVRKENNGALENVITPGVGKNGSRGVQVTSNAGASQDWDTQFWIKINDGMWLQAGDQVNVQFDYKASTNASADTQAHGAPGSYQHWACVGSPNFTTEWQTWNYTLTVDASMAGGAGLGSIAFNLAKDRDQNVTFYFDNIRVWKEEEVEVKSTIPLTDEEKRDTLTYAMNLWLKGMMNACEGKVTSWDLINEAISGTGNVNGLYELQSEKNLRESLASQGKTDAEIESEVANSFFWQDYFTPEMYGVVMEKMAREAYANTEGDDITLDPAGLKLFINDYNLEATWDNNKKLESLIGWIKIWEEKGKELGYNTVIDGIGSQMHISYYLDAEDQKRQEDHIVRMLELMKSSGKLVRISELDMGVCDKQFGTTLKTEEITFEIEQKMADYYKWIIQKYLEIIPANQQYGICQWCLTDAPASSGWRAGEPVGLWTTDYLRKPAYAGWAEGLQNK